MGTMFLGYVTAKTFAKNWSMEHTPAWLVNSFIYLSAAVIAVPLSKAFGLGSIIGYLVAGLAIGPGAWGW